MKIKSYKEILEELEYYKNDSNLNEKDKDKVSKMIDILKSTGDFNSILHNKYIDDAFDSLKNSIIIRIDKCNERKKEILLKNKNYIFDFGSKEIDEINSKMHKYTNLLNELEYLYIRELEKVTSYDDNNSFNLYNECIKSINSQKNSSIKFYGNELKEYVNIDSSNTSKLSDYLSNIDIISKIYNYITKNNLDIITNIVNIGSDIDNYVEKINKLLFIRNNMKNIEIYNRLQESSKKDINYIIEKSTTCDQYKLKLSNRDKRLLLKNRAFDIFYKSTVKNIKKIENSIDKRYSEQLRKDNQLSKYRKYFEKNNFSESDIINCAWIDIDTINSEIDKYNSIIDEKNMLLQEYIDKLSIDSNNEFYNDYETVKNIILYICNNDSNKLSIYIMYLINNMIEIIDPKTKKDIYNDYMANDVIRKFKEVVNQQIKEIDNYGNYKIKIKTR